MSLRPIVICLSGALLVGPGCQDAKEPQGDAAHSNDTNSVSAGDTSGSNSQGNSTRPSTQSGKNNADALAIIDGAVDFLKSAKSIGANADINVIMKGGPFNQDTKTSCRVEFELPNRLFMEVADDTMELKAISNGQDLMVALISEKRYVVGKAPASFGDVTNPFLAGVLQGPLGPTVPGSDLRKSIFAKIQGAHIVGQEMIDGVECDHVRYNQVDVTSDVWIARGSRPVIRKLTQDMSAKMRRMAEGRGNADDFMMQISFQFSNWKPDEAFGLAQRDVSPPKGLEKVAALFDRPGAEPAAKQLVGSEAPEFSLALLDGSTVELTSLRGKVVILDFWATWCSPCVRAMPTIATVANAFQEDGVVLLAVNQREQAEKIKSFLAANKMDVTVALDSDGSVGAKYRAAAIPQTVLIGKKGRVQAVFVGLLPDLEQQLRDGLRKLVDGEDLAPSRSATEDAPSKTAPAGQPEAKTEAAPQ